MKILILADGTFPTNENILRLLRESDRIICCDGAVKKLLDFGREPFAIVGDMDSISPELQECFSDRIFPSADQETNDLTKAVKFCISHNYLDIVILGATGLREDHSLANISLLADYALCTESICIMTDYGRFDAMHASRSFESIPGQQVSIFVLTPNTKITVSGLLYPIENRSFTSWWQGTLNESTGDHFEINTENGCLLIYRAY